MRQYHVEKTADVAIVGAGPVGLTLANLLGVYGVSVVIIESGSGLIDYPRAVMMDDESIRVMQLAGLADAIAPHLTAGQSMQLYNRKGERVISVQPKSLDYGWAKRNSFIQPLVDRVLFESLKRFHGIEVMMDTKFESLVQDDTAVTLKCRSGQGQAVEVRARYAVGCDGGRSEVRKMLGISYDGFTDSSSWIVVDLEKDPLGYPGSNGFMEGRRPFVSISLPDGIRRLEFILKDDETEADITQPARLAEIIAEALPPGADASQLKVLRKRVYTHSARLASSWCVERVLLAGDAAHIMPVWQGQGINSGIRDAGNLAWKLAMVVRGACHPDLLRTYEQERKSHARAMINISVQVGRVLAPRGYLKKFARDAAFKMLNLIPGVRQYILQMKFKPEPFYEEGLVIRLKGRFNGDSLGRLFIQPWVQDRQKRVVRLDDTLGPGFTLLACGSDPAGFLNRQSRRTIEELGINLMTARPPSQLDRGADLGRDVSMIGDHEGRLRDWFADRGVGLVLVRPDRFVASVGYPIQVNEMLSMLDSMVGARRVEAVQAFRQQEVLA